jgi:hypothetical protein
MAKAKNLYNMATAVLGTKPAVKVIGNISRSPDIDPTYPLVISGIKTFYGDAFSQVRLYKFFPEASFEYSYYAAEGDLDYGLALAEDGWEAISIDKRPLAMRLQTTGHYPLATRLEQLAASPMAVMHPYTDDLEHWKIEIRNNYEGNPNRPEIFMIIAQPDDVNPIDEDGRLMKDAFDFEKFEEIRPGHYYAHYFTDKASLLKLEGDLQQYYEAKPEVSPALARLFAIRIIKENLGRHDEGKPLTLPESFKGKLREDQQTIGAKIKRSRRKVYSKIRKVKRGAQEMFFPKMKYERKIQEEILEQQYELAKKTLVSRYTTSVQFTLEYEKAA